MQERKLKLTPINPFTPRQGQIIELRANGLTNQEIALRLNINYQTVLNHIAGDLNHSIRGRIREITGVRPHYNTWIIPLIGGVLLFSQDEGQ